MYSFAPHDPLCNRLAPPYFYSFNSPHHGPSSPSFPLPAIPRKPRRYSLDETLHHRGVPLIISGPRLGRRYPFAEYSDYGRPLYLECLPMRYDGVDAEKERADMMYRSYGYGKRSGMGGVFGDEEMPYGGFDPFQCVIGDDDGFPWERYPEMLDRYRRSRGGWERMMYVQSGGVRGLMGA